MVLGVTAVACVVVVTVWLLYCHKFAVALGLWFLFTVVLGLQRLFVVEPSYSSYLQLYLRLQFNFFALVPERWFLVALVLMLWETSCGWKVLRGVYCGMCEVQHKRHG